MTRFRLAGGGGFHLKICPIIGTRLARERASQV